MDGGKEYKKGLWTEDEDRILMEYVRVHGKGKWNRVSKFTSLKRCGKSCRLRWINYLSPHVKRGDFSEEEQELIIRLHNLLGNRWSLIAGRVPGRTDNQVKNYWYNYLNKKKLGGTKMKGRMSHSSDQQEKQNRKEISISLNVPSESVSELVSSHAGGSNSDKAIENVGDEIRRGGFESSDIWLWTADVDLHVMDPFFGASDDDFAWAVLGFSQSSAS